MAFIRMIQMHYLNIEERFIDIDSTIIPEGTPLKRWLARTPRKARKAKKLCEIGRQELFVDIT